MGTKKREDIYITLSTGQDMTPRSYLIEELFDAVMAELMLAKQAGRKPAAYVSRLGAKSDGGWDINMRGRELVLTEGLTQHDILNNVAAGVWVRRWVSNRRASGVVPRLDTYVLMREIAAEAVMRWPILLAEEPPESEWRRTLYSAAHGHMLAEAFGVKVQR